MNCLASILIFGDDQARVSASLGLIRITKFKRAKDNLRVSYGVGGVTLLPG